MGNHIVKKGENLSQIATQYETNWEDIAEANGLKNPNLIVPGQSLIIPSTNSTSSSGLPKFNNVSWDNSTQGAGALTDYNNAKSDVDSYEKAEWSDAEKYNNLIKEYEDKPAFTYDFNGDALYQQYKDKYIEQGKLAMADTMGQAAAMTGGYGNSYAASVGNQAYQAYLGQLNDIIPELYQLAYNKDRDERNDLLTEIELLRGERDHHDATEEDRYDKLIDKYGIASDAYYKGADIYNADRDTQNSLEQLAWENTLKQKEFDMTEEEHNAKMEAYNTSGDDTQYQSQGTYKGGSYDNGSLTASQVKELQEALGVDADGYYGSKTKKAAGNLSAEEAYKRYVGKPVDKFTGATAKEAVEYMKNAGVPSSYIAGMMTAYEWKLRRNAYLRTGQGGAEVSEYATYGAYATAYTDYAIDKTHGK